MAIEARAKHIKRTTRRRPNTWVNEDGTRLSGDERWAQLLVAAASVFAEKGYKSTALQDIADRLGILKGSLYYYIDSKEELLYEVIREVFRGGVENLQKFAEGPGDGATRLRAVCEGHVAFLAENLDAATVLLHEINTLPPDRRQAITGQDRDYLVLVRRVVQDGQKDGSLRPELDAHLMTFAIMGAVNWVYRWYTPTGRFSPAEVGRQYAEMIIGGLATPPGETRTRKGEIAS